MTKVDSRTVKVKIFLMTVDHRYSNETERANDHLVAMFFTNYSPPKT